MEPVPAFIDEEWESLSRMFSSEDSDFNLHWHGCDLFSNQVINGLSFLANTEDNYVAGAGVKDDVFFPTNTLDSITNLYYVSQESNNSSTEIDNVLFPSQEIFSSFPDLVTSDNYDEHNLLTMPDFSDNRAMEDDLDESVKKMESKRKSETPEQKMEENWSEIPKKKNRVSRDASRMVQSKNKKKVTQNSTEELEKTNGGGSVPSSSSCNSEVDCNGSQESKGSGNLKSNGKTRGSATDSQSLYAWKRRERINERLKILQKLVPNGTKVDISTMLEEAVHYVKFLQHQIKLLSSDDLWMYAPIAYNGMD